MHFMFFAFKQRHQVSTIALARSDDDSVGGIELLLQSGCYINRQSFLSRSGKPASMSYSLWFRLMGGMRVIRIWPKG